MKANRLWIEIITLCCGGAVAFALLIGAIGAVFSGSEATAEAQQSDSPSETPQQASTTQPQTYEGMITCTHCGAKHSAKIGQSAADCTRMCVHGGGSFALVDGEKTYRLNGDLNLLKSLAGRRARVVGTTSGDTINVASIAPEA
jgi:hypothetical protein